MIHLILLSGGSGTRLWPLSNDTRSKQFLKVLRDSDGRHVSMVQRVFEQILSLEAALDITIATTESQVASILEQLDGDYSLVVEPERRDTAPAIMLACADLAFRQHAKLDDPVIVMPIDTFASQEYFESVFQIESVIKSETASLVLLGVAPTYPSEKYGYIVPKETTGRVRMVEKFVEKPDCRYAEELIQHGALWNCGVFGFQLGYMVNILDAYIPSREMDEIRSSYTRLPKNSFDYEIVEKAESVAVVPYEGIWKDLGTWNTLTEEMDDEISGRVVLDASTCKNVHVVNETGLPLVVAGLSDSVVVATPDGVLVSGKEESGRLKPLIAKAASSRPMYEKRQWGEYRVLDSSVYPDGGKSLTKELILNAGSQLSYQRHLNRSEIWTVVDGIGEVVIDDNILTVKRGSVVNIHSGSMHSAYAIEKLRIIEVQIGSQLEETDIERFGHYWS